MKTRKGILYVILASFLHAFCFNPENTLAYSIEVGGIVGEEGKGDGKIWKWGVK